MRICSVCVIAFVLMLTGQCSAFEFMRVTQPGFFQTQKGGEARGKRLHHRRMVSAHRKASLRHALSVAIPQPRPFGDRVFGRALAEELLPTPQQRIDATFQQLEETNAGTAKR
jgi:hypothetical protein